MPKPSGSTKREKQPMRTLANRREPARGTELGRTARLMPEHLALRVPRVEACDVERRRQRERPGCRRPNCAADAPLRAYWTLVQ
jgi:hypothetical protein